MNYILFINFPTNVSLKPGDKIDKSNASNNVIIISIKQYKEHCRLLKSSKCDFPY